jgi:hypothetical protein
MSSRADFFIKKTLGEDFLQSLEKFELWKPGTKTVIDHEEIKTALKIVPRAVLSLLIAELAPMAIGETKEINLPFQQKSLLRVTKHERDVYSGDIEEENKKIVDFKFRSIPGVGLVVMSAFELYNVDDLEKKPEIHVEDDSNAKVQRMIDERLALHSLVNKVVDQKIEQRDAIKQLLLAKITQNMAEKKEDSKPTQKEEPKSKKISPLGGFLEQYKSKIKKNEYPVIRMTKGEHVNCPDCGKDIYNGQVFSGCICFGDDMDKKVYITKAEKGVKVRFGRGWDPENIEMLLEVLRSKRG